MEGRKPEGMDAATSAVFPDEFHESEIGLIPKGWSVGSIGDVCKLRREGVSIADLAMYEHYVGLEHIDHKTWSLAKWGSPETISSNKNSFQKRDVLFGKLRPYFHKVAIAPMDGVCSTDILVLKPSEKFWYGFMLNWMSSDEVIDYATRLSNGARMPRINWKDIANYKVPLPPKALAEHYDDLTKSLVDKILTGVHHMRTLASLRDTLLPRLISGKLRVPEAEAMLAEVM